MNQRVKAVILRIASFPAYAYLYWRSMHGQGDRHRDREVLFQEFIRERPEERSLQIGVRGAKFGPNWVSVDFYDASPEIDYHCDVADLPFEDGIFDRVVCNAILEHVINPVDSIEELHRVLKIGGQIWVEVPFHQPFHPSPHDFWRVSVEGLRAWMQGFRELRSGAYSIHSCFYYTGVFFWGEKAAPDA